MRSNTSNGPAEWAEEISRRMRELLGRVRRMSIRLTSRSTWQVLGHVLLDGRVETHNPEVFSGIGFYARPKDNGRSEAIVEFVGGGAGQPVVIATRDEDTRKKVAGDLAENETQMHNDLAVVRIKANGTIELRLAAGIAEKMIKGETYRAAEDVMLTALASAFSALAAPVTPLDAATKTACAAAATAITTFKTGAAAYLATVGKVQ